jgi:hypothetical protein
MAAAYEAGDGLRYPTEHGSCKTEGACLSALQHSRHFVGRNDEPGERMASVNGTCLMSCTSGAGIGRFEHCMWHFSWLAPRTSACPCTLCGAAGVQSGPSTDPRQATWQKQGRRYGTRQSRRCRSAAKYTNEIVVIISVRQAGQEGQSRRRPWLRQVRQKPSWSCRGRGQDTQLPGTRYPHRSGSDCGVPQAPVQLDFTPLTSSDVNATRQRVVRV